MVEYSDILNRARTNLLSNTDIKTFAEGSIAREIVNLYATEASQIFNVLNRRTLQALITEATGDFLDQLGYLVGIERNTDKLAYGEVTFYIDKSFNLNLSDLKSILIDKGAIAVTDDIFFPKGTLVASSEGNVVYKTTEDVIISDDDAVVPVISTASGFLWNVGAGELSVFINSVSEFSSIEDYILIKNDLAIETGMDEESDDNYRYRIINAFATHAKANEIAVRIAALSVPGVSNVYIRNFENGIGTFSLYVVSDSPIVSEGIINAVQEAVNSTVAQGIRAVVTTPEYEAVHMELILQFIPGTNVSDQNTLTNNASSVVIDYINNLRLGEELIINKVIDIIFDLSDNIKDIEIGLFGKGEYDITNGIIKNYEPLILNNQTIDYTSKWITNKKLIVACKK